MLEMFEMSDDDQDRMFKMEGCLRSIDDKIEKNRDREMLQIDGCLRQRNTHCTKRISLLYL